MMLKDKKTISPYSRSQCQHMHNYLKSIDQPVLKQDDEDEAEQQQQQHKRYANNNIEKTMTRMERVRPFHCSNLSNKLQCQLPWQSHIYLHEYPSDQRDHQFHLEEKIQNM